MSSVLTASAAVESAHRDPFQLWRSAGLLTVAQLAQASGAFLALWVLVRQQGLVAAGEFSYALAITAPAAQLLSLQLKALLLTHAAAEFGLPGALGLRLLTLPLALLTALLLAWFAGSLSAVWFLTRTVESWAEIFQAAHQRQNAFVRASFGPLLRTPLLLLSLSLMHNLQEACWLYLGLSLLVLVFIDSASLGWQVELRPRASWLWLQKGTNLGLVLFLYLGASNLPRIVLEKSSGPAVLGAFASLFVVAQTGNLVASALGQSLLPLFASAGAGQILRWLAIPAIPALLFLPLLWQFAAHVLAWLGIPDSMENQQILKAVALCQCLIWPAAMAGCVLTARRHYRRLQWIAWLILVVSLLASILLVPNGGAVGAVVVLGLQSMLLLVVAITALGTREQPA